MAKITIALAGNPNCGKTTLFNALTGSNQYVGNWPGVTVEEKHGRLRGHPDVTIADLPGIYSLSPYTLEEVVARDYLTQQRPDAILNIVDGTNLERNLYLTTQLVELGIPTLVAVNMMDVVERSGDVIDLVALSKALDCKVVPISALKGTGVREAAEEAVALARGGTKPIPQHRFAGSVEHAIAHIEESAVHDLPEEQQRWYAIKLFERDEKVRERLALPIETVAHIDGDIEACEAELDDDAESIITSQRYDYITSIIGGCLRRANKGELTASDRIDRVVTNRVAALPLFVLVMWLVYALSVGKSLADGGIAIGTYLTDWANDVLGAEWLVAGSRSLLEGMGVSPVLTGLVSDGIVNGVGAVLGFVPQMLVLFLMLAILEDCGYMARIAFIMDRIFRRFGLSGKSFIPMLIGTGCGIPGVMASRTIENERDRRMTIMTTCFIPCSAKMPHHRPHRRRPVRRRHLDRHLRLLHRCGGHRHLGRHAQEDQDVRRRPGTLRHGASRLPRTVRGQRAAQHLGARLVVHQEGRHHHPAVLHRHLGPQELRHRQRHLRHGRRPLRGRVRRDRRVRSVRGGPHGHLRR